MLGRVGRFLGRTIGAVDTGLVYGSRFAGESAGVVGDAISRSRNATRGWFRGLGEEFRSGYAAGRYPSRSLHLKGPRGGQVTPEYARRVYDRRARMRSFQRRSAASQRSAAREQARADRLAARNKLKSETATNNGAGRMFGTFGQRALIGGAAGAVYGQIRGNGFGDTMGSAMVGAATLGIGGSVLKRVPAIKSLGSLGEGSTMSGLSVGAYRKFTEFTGFGHGVSPHVYSAVGLGGVGFVAGGMVGHPFIGAVAGATLGFKGGTKYSKEELKNLVAAAEARKASRTVEAVNHNVSAGSV